MEKVCGCFGASSTEIIGYSTLIRAIVIAVLNILAYFWVIFRPYRSSTSLKADTVE